MEDKEDFKEALREVFDERKGIDEATHSAHHKFIDEEIERRSRRVIIRDRVRAQVLGWGLITLLAAIGTGAYQLLKTGIKGP